jgi:hypothetical protein
VPANASPSGVQARIFFYAISFQSINGKALTLRSVLKTCGSKANEFLLFLKYNEQRNAVAAATVSI